MGRTWELRLQLFQAHDVTRIGKKLTGNKTGGIAIRLGPSNLNHFQKFKFNPCQDEFAILRRIEESPEVTRANITEEHIQPHKPLQVRKQIQNLRKKLQTYSESRIGNLRTEFETSLQRFRERLATAISDYMFNIGDEYCMKRVLDEYIQTEYSMDKSNSLLKQKTVDVWRTRKKATLGQIIDEDGSWSRWGSIFENEMEFHMVTRREDGFCDLCDLEPTFQSNVEGYTQPGRSFHSRADQFKDSRFPDWKSDELFVKTEPYPYNMCWFYRQIRFGDELEPDRPLSSRLHLLAGLYGEVQAFRDFAMSKDSHVWFDFIQLTKATKIIKYPDGFEPYLGDVGSSLVPDSFVQTVYYGWNVYLGFESGADDVETLESQVKLLKSCLKGKSYPSVLDDLPPCKIKGYLGSNWEEHYRFDSNSYRSIFDDITKVGKELTKNMTGGIAVNYGSSYLKDQFKTFKFYPGQDDSAILRHVEVSPKEIRHFSAEHITPHNHFQLWKLIENLRKELETKSQSRFESLRTDFEFALQRFKEKLTKAMFEYKFELGDESCIKMVLNEYLESQYAPNKMKALVNEANFKATCILIGEAGSGKSCLINSLANYLSFGSLDEASREPRTLCPIPTAYSRINQEGELETVAVGHSPNEKLVEDHTHTLNTICHVVQLADDRVLRLVDTSGFDKEDPVQEEVESIMELIVYYGEVRALCFVVDCNEREPYQALRGIYRKVEDAFRGSANILFLFTNYNQKSLQFRFIKQVRQTMAEDIEEENQFKLDNGSLTFLLTKDEPSTSIEDMVVAKKSWNSAASECTRFITRLFQLSPFPPPQDFLPPLDLTPPEEQYFRPEPLITGRGVSCNLAPSQFLRN